MTDIEKAGGDVADHETASDPTNSAELEEWLALRKKAGLKIDPETAEVDCWYAATLDPYGVDPNLPEEYRQVGREYFARAPESEVWVSFDDLSEEVVKRIWQRMAAGDYAPSAPQEAKVLRDLSAKETWAILDSLAPDIQLTIERSLDGRFQLIISESREGPERRGSGMNFLETTP